MGGAVVVNRMDTLNQVGHLMFIKQRYIPGRELYSEFIGQIFEKSGEVRVRDSCSKERVEYRV